MSSTLITPGYSGKKPDIERPGVESFQRSLPQDPGKFFTPFCRQLGGGDRQVEPLEAGGRAEQVSPMAADYVNNIRLMAQILAGGMK